jgi:hypothetical protein
MTYEVFGNEIVMLSIGTGVLIFILSNRERLKRLGAHRILIASFCLMQAGWILTVLEGFFYEWLLNFMEHLCYAASSILLMTWCWKVFGKGIPFYTRAHNTSPVSKETV